jgi:glycosyltransferase involved in cell wall biosynthesis
MNVLQVIGAGQYGGGVPVLRSYVDALHEHGCRVTMVANDEAVAGVFRDAGCTVVAVEAMKRDIAPRHDVVALRDLRRLIRGGRFDVVHTHSSKGGFLGRAAARLEHVPIVLHTAHGWAFHEASSAGATLVYANLERLAARWCDRVITVSDYHRNQALERGIAAPERIVTIHNGIAPPQLDPTRTTGAVRGSLGLEGGTRLIVAVGRLVEQKGFDTLVDAVPHLIRDEPDVRVVVVGDGPLRSDLTAQIDRLQVGRAVHLAGFHSDVPDVVAAADVVVSPSRWEGLSIALLEAMALGKPIVATRIGGNAEALDDGVSGALVPRDDPAAFAGAIAALLADPQRAAELGSAAQARYAERFTERRMQDELWRLYEELRDTKLSRPAGGT